MRGGGIPSISPFNTKKKHSLVLLSTDDFAMLLFVGEHQSLLHAGPQLPLSSTRERFWPLGDRSLARHVGMDCVNCFKVSPSLDSPIMGDL